MPIVFIVLVLGAVFIYGGIKGVKPWDLLLGEFKSLPTSSPSSSSGSDTTGAGGLTTSPSYKLVPGSKTFPLLSAASQYLGVKYVFGGNDPNIGIDCSRFVQLVYQDVGINLPRTTYAQFKQGTPVDLSNLQVGDVIFTEPSPIGPGHEGLYVGNNQVQESPHSGIDPTTGRPEVNKIIPLSTFLSGGFVGARRYLG